MIQMTLEELKSGMVVDVTTTDGTTYHHATVKEVSAEGVGVLYGRVIAMFVFVAAHEFAHATESQD